MYVLPQEFITNLSLFVCALAKTAEVVQTVGAVEVITTSWV